MGPIMPDFGLLGPLVGGFRAKMDPGAGPVTTHLFFLSFLIRAALKKCGTNPKPWTGGGEELGPHKTPPLAKS